MTDGDQWSPSEGQVVLLHISPAPEELLINAVKLTTVMYHGYLEFKGWGGGKYGPPDEYDVPVSGSFMSGELIELFVIDPADPDLNPTGSPREEQA
jgi:hypothetical protein